MKHRLEPYWDMARLQEELDPATKEVEFYRAKGRLTPREEKRMASWESYDHALRNRMTFVGVTAELDAMEAN